MIAQVIFTLLLGAVMLVAFANLQGNSLIGGFVISAALFGTYLVWLPDHASHLANLMGIGRGADLVLYVWVLISSAILLLLYLNSREQLHLITTLARKLALSDAEEDATTCQAREPRNHSRNIKQSERRMPIVDRGN